jgi:F1F0 ATPase subunit 2
MTETAVMDHGLMPLLAQAATWLAAGVVLGGLYFVSLRSSVGMLASGRPLPAIGLQLVRFAVLAVVLAFVSRWFGALPLLLATLGLLVARTAVLRRERGHG